MLDVVFGFLSGIFARRMGAWRKRQRGARHDRGARFSAPCAVRVQSATKSRWRQGHVAQKDDVLVCTPNFGTDKYTLRFESVRFLLVRAPTDAEVRLLAKDMVVYRVRADEHLLDIGLAVVDAERFRELLETPTGL